MKRYQMSESLPVGLLLALAGGILDSYTYLNRGQVFATAETGNLVLLGIHLAQGELGRVLSCLFPILAFALGVLTTEGLRRRLSSGRVHWRQPILAAECLVILVVSFLPQGRSGRPGQCAHRLYQRHPDREFPKICRLRMRHHHVHRQPEERHRAPVPLAPPP